MSADASQETGTTAIASGAESVAVAFTVAKSAATYRFSPLLIVNTTDAAPNRIRVATVTAKDANGFTAQLNGELDTANYSIMWGVQV